MSVREGRRSCLHPQAVAASIQAHSNKANVLRVVFSESLFEINYPDLSRWTKTIPNAPSACFVTFGPGLSYFACAPGHGSTWAGVSSDLTDKVQKAFDTPSCVSLGMNQAWFVMWPDGYYAWKFYGKYGGLDKILTEAAPRSVSVRRIYPRFWRELMSASVSFHLPLQQGALLRRIQGPNRQIQLRRRKGMDTTDAGSL